MQLRASWGRLVRRGVVGVLGMWLACQAWAGQPLFFWELRDGEGAVRAHLYGTVHVCDARCTPPPRPVTRALDRASLLVLELDPEDMGLPYKIAQAGRLPAGQTLNQILSPGLMARLNGAAARLGLAPQMLQPMQPWLVNALLGVQAAARAGYRTENGVDLWLAQVGRGRRLRLEALETPERQIAALSAGGDTAQHAALAQTVDLVLEDRFAAYFAELLAAWRAGDVATLDQLMQEEVGSDAAPVMEALLDARNLEMAAAIEQQLKPGKRPFIAVGAGHMGGPRGLLALLAARGFRPVQVELPE